MIFDVAAVNPGELALDDLTRTRSWAEFIDRTTRIARLLRSFPRDDTGHDPTEFFPQGGDLVDSRHPQPLDTDPGPSGDRHPGPRAIAEIFCDNICSKSSRKPIKWHVTGLKPP